MDTNRYHWGLIVGPKEESDDSRGTRYHVRDRQVGAGQARWDFEQQNITLAATNMLLVRVLIGKVTNRQRLQSALESIPVRQGDPAWNCVIWVKQALAELQADKKAIGTSQLDWRRVRDTAMKYVQDKKDQHRFDGRAPQGKFDMRNAATFDLLAGREVIA